MNADGVRGWFESYLDAFGALGRGEREDIAELLAYYQVPLLLSLAGSVRVLSTEEEVLGAARKQIDGLLAAGYDHSVVLDSDIDLLNPACALYRGDFSRRRADGSEVGRLHVTYLIADAAQGLRIAALVVHSP